MSDDLALDFGTNMTRIADDRAQMLFEEPTLAAVDHDSGRLLAFGREANDLAAQSAGRVLVMHPVRYGELVDMDVAAEVLANAFRRIGVTRVSRPRVLVSTHVGVMNVQLRALDRALRKAGARQVRFVEQPIASAIGADLVIAEPTGSMVIDVGAGTTDMGVMALGGIVTSTSLRAGGDVFDDAIRQLLAQRYGLVVAPDLATEIVHTAGALEVPEEDFEVFGRDLSSGETKTVILHSADVTALLREAVESIVQAAVTCITTAPPDLANDLLDSGLVLCGGASALSGFAQVLSNVTGVAVHASKERGSLAVKGAARCMSMMDELADAFSEAPRH